MIHEQDMRITVTSTLGEGTGTGIVILRYDSADPYAVHLVLPEQEWVFSRDLLLDSFAKPRVQGVGDVQVLDDEAAEKTIVFLDSPEGVAALKFERSDIETFLTESFEIVPFGDESEHLNAELETFLSGILTASEE